MEELKASDLQKEFIEIYNTNIKREGSQKLLEWLQSTDFFTAPASTKFHSNIEGGLCLHSINAYKRFKKIIQDEYGTEYSNVISDESIAIIGLLHDVCKANFYSMEYRNVKVDGAWVQKPYYAVDEDLPYGHGEKSVYIINGFIKLTREEALAINWHMGGFDARVKGGSFSFSQAYYKYPVSVLFHVADVLTTYLDEVVYN